jgi:hypothetical protein
VRPIHIGYKQTHNTFDFEQTIFLCGTSQKASVNYQANAMLTHRDATKTRLSFPLESSAQIVSTVSIGLSLISEL